jgi:endonuclease YncB( thermonuclease family)
MRFLLPILFLLFVLTPAYAGDAQTLTVDGTRYRLDGIDAPEISQSCIDEAGGVYPCGLLATEALHDFIGDRQVRCEDRGADPTHPARRIGRCAVAGIDLNRWLVHAGWALNFGPSAQGRFKDDEREAQERRRGMWKGCFVAPHDLRYWNKNASLLGASCPWDARAQLFRTHVGCEIKGKYAVRAQLTGHRGVYHMPGCGSYRRTQNADRWFCTEEEAIAAGFRRSYTCWLK